MSRIPVAPPTSIVWTVESWAPGVYQDFWSRVVGALQGRPVGVTSYWRDPHTNAAVGGNPDSQHLIGLGVDLVFPSDADANEATSALASRGLVAVNERTHVHVQQWRAGVARRAGLLAALGF